MLNDALFYDNYEIIGGEKFMSPAPKPVHSNAMGALYTFIAMYLQKNKNGYAFPDSVDIHLPDGNIFRPDLTVITAENSKIINWNKAIYGVPDMVVEVLSKSTFQNDLGIKKQIYEKNGVKEYWIVDTWRKSITVYILRAGKYEKIGEYLYYDEDDWADLTEDQRAEVKLEIKLSIFDDCIININDIFEWFAF